MVACHYLSCSFNQKHQCTASGDLNLDDSGRCLVAAQKQQDELENIIEFLDRFGSYPFDEEKDREFFQEILDDFPGLDIIEQLKSFQAWILDRSEDRKIGYRSTIRKWVRRTYERNSESEKRNENTLLKRIK